MAENNKERTKITSFNGWSAKLCIWLICSAASLLLLAVSAGMGKYNIFDLTPDNIIPPLPVYAGDFSLVFASRLFIGTVTRLLGFKLGYEKIKLMCGITVLISLVLLSLLCGRIMQFAVEYKNFPVFLTAVLMNVIPMVSQGNLKIYGSYDTYWLILFILGIFLFRNKSYIAVVPVVCFAAVLVHYGFLVSFFPAIAALFVYVFFHAESKREKTLCASSAGLTAVSCVGLTFYSLLFANDRLKMTAAEFHEYLLSRLNLSGVEKIRLAKVYGENLLPADYYEGYFFDYLDPDKVETDMNAVISGMIEPLKNVPTKIYFLYLFACIPVLLLFAFIWCRCIKKARGAEKIPFICFIAVQLFMFVGVFLSTDLWRWTAAALISQAGLMLAMFMKKDSVFLEAINIPLMKKKPIVILICAAGAAYAVFLLKFGRHLPTIDSMSFLKK